MKILVTGGTGVIGAGAIRELLSAEHQIRLLSRHAERDAPAFPAALEPFAANIAEPATLPAAIEGCDVVLHVAGIVDEQPPEITYQKINVDGTRHLVEAAARAGSPYFIHISSLGADRGSSDYHKSKLAAEKIVQDYPGAWLILRPGSVYGPGDETISILLKMVRTLPAVPIVDTGAQLFQPLWFMDFGAAIAQAVVNRRLAGRILELAGPDVTSTNDVIELLAHITDRDPSRISVPAWLAQFGANATEAFDGAGKKLLRYTGLEPPLSPAKLQMLLEGNVISDESHNALLTEFVVSPTALDDGLAMLSDLVPEQVPGEGVGAVERSVYFADIHESSHNPESLLTLVCERFCDIMPIEFAAEPGVTKQLATGRSLTGAIPGRGNIQVRVQERTATRVTMMTLEGHPLAGLLSFATETHEKALRFSVQIAGQAADAVDWLAMRTIGGRMQRQNWRSVVRRVVEFSGGKAPRGVQRRHETLSDEEARELQSAAENIVRQRQRRELEREIPSAQA